ncbi:MAG: ABC transporter permease [Cyclobacteriaceae bacterium]|nr:ABC transporter permease [Cyclobacteriaceae bacterium]
MDQHQKITIYSADNSDRSVFRHLREVFSELPEAHELGYRLFKRNIMAMYRQSLLGVVWAIFPPLITAALWIFLRGNVISVADTAVPYPVFVLVGTMLWQIFTESILAPLKAITSNKSMLVKINIPREGLLLSGIYEVLFNVLIKIFLLAIIFIAFKQSISFSVLLVIPGILSIMICGFAVGLLLTPIGMLYTDINRGLTIALPFLMYLAPVIYPMPTSGSMAVLMKLNPVATLLVETRNWFTSQPAEDIGLFLLYTGIFALISFLGLMIFRVSMPMIIERIGS